MTVEGRTHECMMCALSAQRWSCCGSNTLETQNSATEKRDGRWPARASCQGPTKTCWGCKRPHCDRKTEMRTRRQKRELRSDAESKRPDQGSIKGDTEAAQKRRERLKKRCRQHSKGSTRKGLPLGCCGRGGSSMRALRRNRGSSTKSRLCSSSDA